MASVNIRRLHPSDETMLEAFLLPRLETSMFLIGNMRTSGLAYNGERYTGDYVAAFEEGHIVGAAVHFWNGIIIAQAPVHLDALCRAALAASDRPLKGVVGPHEQVAAVKATLDLDRYERQLDEREELYSLNLAALQMPESQPVATSAFNTRIREAVRIGGVWTPPEFRLETYLQRERAEHQ